MPRMLLVFAALLTACGDPQNGKDQDALPATPGKPGQALASACSGCHTPGGTAISDLTGWTKSDLVSRMQFYRGDADGISVMHRLARGYTEEEIKLIAAYLAAESGALE